MNKKDYLWENLTSLPYFRALLRSVESRVYQQFDLQRPILDLGCGDGHFAAMTFTQPLDVGIDPWMNPLRKALRANAYQEVIHGNGECLPFPDKYFKSIISNSVLEHIPEVDLVLGEVSRVLCEDGLFIFCVPNHYFLNNLSISKFLDGIRLKKLGDHYRAFFNKISRHFHCDSPEIWEKRLSIHGLQIQQWWHYFSPQALSVLEWGHYLGLPAFISHLLFNKWILVQKRWNLSLTECLVRPYYNEDPVQANGSYTFYIVRRN